MKQLLSAFIQIFFTFCCGFAYAEQPIPPLNQAVTDLTGTLSSSVAAELNAELITFSRTQGSQIAVLIVASTLPETIEQYSIRVAEQWKIGRKDTNDGVLLIVAKNDRRIRIEVGYGLEGAIPDVIAKRIIEEVILPEFRRQDFASGIRKGIAAIANIIKGEPLALPAKSNIPTNGNSGRNSDSGLFVLVIAGLFFASLLQAILGQIAGSAVAASISAGVGLLIFPFLSAVIIGLVVFIFSLSGISSSRSWNSRGGFGGGGFGGSGGSFGGGGASGRW